MKSKLRKPNMLGVVVPALIIVAWIFLPSILDIPQHTLPPFRSIVYGLIDFAFGTHNFNMYSGTMLQHVTASIGRVLSGFAVAVALGLTFGYISGCSITIYRLFSPVINFIRSIPGIAWLPISIVWFGIGNNQSIFLISLAAFFPIFANTCHGVQAIDKELIAVSKTFGANALQTFRYVIFPLSLRDVSVGLRIGLGFSWAYLVLGEMTGVNRGLGAVMQDSRMLGQTQMIIVCMLVIALTAKIFDKLLHLLLKAAEDL
ncbi:MAG: ABC transporter permease [Oscillospiraceae bacterium]|nr:ABC transporter permease [Oscillospiraceae bacterium]